MAALMVVTAIPFTALPAGAVGITNDVVQNTPMWKALANVNGVYTADTNGIAATKYKNADADGTSLLIRELAAAIRTYIHEDTDGRWKATYDKSAAGSDGAGYYKWEAYGNGNGSPINRANKMNGTPRPNPYAVAEFQGSSAALTAVLDKYFALLPRMAIQLKNPNTTNTGAGHIARAMEDFTGNGSGSTNLNTLPANQLMALPPSAAWAIRRILQESYLLNEEELNNQKVIDLFGAPKEWSAMHTDAATPVSATTASGTTHNSNAGDLRESNGLENGAGHVRFSTSIPGGADGKGSGGALSGFTFLKNFGAFDHAGYETKNSCGTVTGTYPGFARGGKVNWARAAVRIVSKPEDIALTLATVDDLASGSAPGTIKEYFMDVGAYCKLVNGYWSECDYMFATDSQGTSVAPHNSTMGGFGTREIATTITTADLYAGLNAYRTSATKGAGSGWAHYGLGDLIGLSRAEMFALRDRLEGARSALSGKNYFNEAQLIQHFGLPTSSEISVVLRGIELLTQENPWNYQGAVDYFGDVATGKLTTDPWFGAEEADTLDPTAGYNGYDLKGLEELLAEATGYYSQLSFAYNDPAFDVAAAYGTQFDDIRTWMGNLQKVVNLWKLNEQKAKIEEFLANLPDYRGGLVETTPGDPATAAYTPEKVVEWYTQAQQHYQFASALQKKNYALTNAVYAGSAVASDPANTPLDGTVGLVQELAIQVLGLFSELKNAMDAGRTDIPAVSTGKGSDDLSYFTDLYMKDLVKFVDAEGRYRLVTEGLYDMLTEAVKRLQALPAGTAEEIAFKADIAEPAVERLWPTLASVFSRAVTQAMAEIQAMADAGLLVLNKTAPQSILPTFANGTGGTLTTAQKEAAMRAVNDLQRIYYTIEDQSIYHLFKDQGQTGRLAAGVMKAFEFLSQSMPELLGWLAHNPTQYYTGTTLAPLSREAKAEDILPDHDYTDSKSGTNDLYLGQAINKLDRFLGSSGNLAPLLSALKSLSPQLAQTLEDMGVDFTKTTQSGGEVLDSIVGGTIFTDEVVNTIVGMLYPLICESFEDIWLTSIAAMAADNGGKLDERLNQGCSTFGITTNIRIYGRFFSLYSRLANAENRTNDTFAQLKIYPNLLGDMIASSGFASKFPNAISALRNFRGGVDTEEQNWIQSWKSPYQKVNGAWTYTASATKSYDGGSSYTNRSYLAFCNQANLWLGNAVSSKFSGSGGGYAYGGSTISNTDQSTNHSPEAAANYLPELNNNETSDQYLKRIGPKARPGSPEATPDDPRYNPNMGKDHIYPTGAWSEATAPALYKDGKFYLDWGINDATSLSEKRERFMDAIAIALKGLSPMLSSLLFGKKQEVYCYSIGVVNTTSTGSTAITVSDTQGVGALDMLLQFDGGKAFGTMLVPLFEALLGADSAKTWSQLDPTILGASNVSLNGVVYSGSSPIIPDDTTAQSYLPTIPAHSGGAVHSDSVYTGYQSGDMMPALSDAQAKNLVNTIFGPLDAFLYKMAKAPLTELLKLLPNLAFAMSADRMHYLMDKLGMNISYEAWVVLTGVGGLGASSFPKASFGKADALPLDVRSMLMSGDVGDTVNGFLGSTKDLSNFLGQFLSQDTVAFLDEIQLASLGELHTDYPTRRVAENNAFLNHNQDKLINGYRDTRYYVEANPTDVFKFMINWLMRSGMIPVGYTVFDTSLRPTDIGTANQKELDEALMALTELLAPNGSKYAQLEFKQSAPTIIPHMPFAPDWWGEGGQHNKPYGDVAGEYEGLSDADYLIKNSGPVLDIVWKVLFGEPFVDGAKRMAQKLSDSANQQTFNSLVDMVHGLLDKEVLFQGQQVSIYNLLSSMSDLVNHALMIGGANSGDWISMNMMDDIVDKIYNYAQNGTYYGTGVGTLDNFIAAVTDLFEPIAPILDYLLAGKTLGIYQIDNNVPATPTYSPLLELPGFLGYENALWPILNVLAIPLGLKLDKPADYLAMSDATARLKSIVGSLAEIVTALLGDPVQGLLNVLPNLLAFIMTPANGEDSGLQSAASALVQPLYVLIDTLRPMVDVSSIFSFDLSSVPGVSFDTSDGLRIDTMTLLQGLLKGNTIQFGGREYDLPTMMEELLAGEWRQDPDTGLNYVEADGVTIIFKLLDAMGVLETVNDFAELTKLIQYNKFPDFNRIDYAKGPKPGDEATPLTNAPTWFSKDKAKFLADNTDAVINWAWRALFEGNADAKTWAQNALNSFTADVNGAKDALIAKLDPSGQMSYNPALDLNIEIKDTLDATVDALFGNDFFTKENLFLLVQILMGLNTKLTEWEINLEIPDPMNGGVLVPVTLKPKELMAQLLSVDGVPLDFDQMIGGVDPGSGMPFGPSMLFYLRYTDPTTASYMGLQSINITGKDDFVAELLAILAPFMQVLNLFLAGKDLKIIMDDEVNDNEGFLTIYGYDGYNNGLLPLLAALGADIDGYVDSLVLPEDYKAADTAGQAAAIIEPILYLLKAFVTSPTQTLLKIIPNVAHILSNVNGESIAEQALMRLLAPFTRLIIEIVPELDALRREDDGAYPDDGNGNIDLDELSNRTSAIRLVAGDDSLVNALLLSYLPQFGLTIESPMNVGLGEYINGLLAAKIPQIAAAPLSLSAFTLEDLITGVVTEFTRDEIAALDLNNKATYVDVDTADMLTELLLITGVFDLLDEKDMESLWSLINNDPLADFSKIDYQKAPLQGTQPAAPNWFDKTKAQFLADNADAVINWSWAAIFENPDAKLWAQNALIGLTNGAVSVTVEDTLQDTVAGWLGDNLYTHANLTAFAQMIFNLKAQVQGPIEIQVTDTIKVPLYPIEMLKKLITVGGATVDLDEMFDTVEAYLSNPTQVSGADDFINTLADFVAPLMPALNLFLAGKNLKIIDDQDVADGEGFLRLYGYDGYERGLLPLLAALGADVEGYLEPGVLVLPEDYKNAPTAQDQAKAILNPILFLLNALVESPVQTLLHILPNMAYILSNGTGDSVMEQAILRLLAPLTLVAIDVLGIQDSGFQAIPKDEIRLIAGQNSFLATALRVVLARMGKDLGDYPDDIGLGGALDQVLEDVLPVSIINPFKVEDLITGDITKFEAPFDALGTEASYVKVNKGDLLTELLIITGVFDLLDEQDMASLWYFINNAKPEEFDKINYQKAPLQGTAVGYPNWLKPAQAQYLVDNADAVINWAWDQLIAGNAAGKSWLEGLLGNAFTVEDTLQDTINGWLGDNLFTADNLKAIAGTIYGLKATIEGPILLDVSSGLQLPLYPLQILKKLITIDGQALDLNQVFEPLGTFLNGTVSVTGADDFVEQLSALVAPLMPILNVLLAGKNLKAIDDATVADGEGFLRLYGYEGYADGLLPLLAGLGADLPGFLNTLVLPDDYKNAATAQDQAKAILNPVLFLLNALVETPVQTVLHLLPNVAYLLSNGSGDSIAEQAVIRLFGTFATVATDILKIQDGDFKYAVESGGIGEVQLLKGPNSFGATVWRVLSKHLLKFFPDLLSELLAAFGVGFAPDESPLLYYTLGLGESINKLLAAMLEEVQQFADIPLKTITLESLIVGKVKVFDGDDFKALGLNGQGSYVEVNVADLLTQVMNLLGVFDFLEQKNMTGLVELLNTGLMNSLPGHISYPDYKRNEKLYKYIWWCKGSAKTLSNNLDKYVNNLCQIILGKPLGSVPLKKGGGTANGLLYDLLGSALYTKENLESIAKLLKDKIPNILGTQIGGTGKTIDDFLSSIIQVNGVDFDATAALQHIYSWTAPEVTDKTSFVNGLKDFLIPLMPVLDFMLAGSDITMVHDETINNNLGFLKATGYDGYRYGLLPILEALLMPLNAKRAITSVEKYRTLDANGKLDAILNPVLYFMEQLATGSTKTVMQILPNVCYFLSDSLGQTTPEKKSAMQQSLDRVLYALNHVYGAATGSKLLEVDVNAEIDKLLKSLDLGLSAKTLDELILGNVADYRSFADVTGKYINPGIQDQADALTVLLRALINTVKDSAVRDKLIALLGDSLGLSGTPLKLLTWALNVAAWIAKTFKSGTDYIIHWIFGLLRVINFFTPMILWIKKLVAK
jgi:hypothetical protein